MAAAVAVRVGEAAACWGGSQPDTAWGLPTGDCKPSGHDGGAAAVAPVPAPADPCRAGGPMMEPCAPCPCRVDAVSPMHCRTSGGGRAVGEGRVVEGMGDRVRLFAPPAVAPMLPPAAGTTRPASVSMDIARWLEEPSIGWLAWLLPAPAPASTPSMASPRRLLALLSRIPTAAGMLAAVGIPLALEYEGPRAPPAVPSTCWVPSPRLWTSPAAACCCTPNGSERAADGFRWEEGERGGRPRGMAPAVCHGPGDVDAPVMAEPNGPPPAAAAKADVDGWAPGAVVGTIVRVRWPVGLAAGLRSTAARLALLGVPSLLGVAAAAFRASSSACRWFQVQGTR